MVTWESNRRLIAGLWPQYAPTPEEMALFAERLGHRRQDWLEEALKRHRSEDHDGAYKPRLARIIAHYDAIRTAGDRADSAGPAADVRTERVTAEDCESDAQCVLAEMLGWSPDRRAAVVAEMRRVGVATLAAGEQYPDDVRRWSRAARGLAHAIDARRSAKT